MGITASSIISFLVGMSSASAFWMWLYTTQCKRTRRRILDYDDNGGIIYNSTNNQDDIESRTNSTYAKTCGIRDTSYLSDMLRGLWPNVRAVAQESIRAVMHESLSSSGIDCSLQTLDLGTTAPRLDNVIVRERKGDSLQMDLDVTWNATVAIGLSCLLGKFGISGVQLRGRMSVLMKPLTFDSTIVQALQYSFVNTPRLDLHFSGLASVAELQILERKVRQIVSETLESMCVLPNRMYLPLTTEYNLMQMYEPPLGIAHVTVVKGRGFTIEKRGFGRKDDIPDVYCKVLLGPETPNNPTWRTETIQNSLSPVWPDASHDFLLSDFDQLLSIHAWDEDKGPLDGDDDLGKAKVTIGELLLSGGTKELELLDGDNHGTGAYISVSCCHYPLSNNIRDLDLSTVDNNAGLLNMIVTRGYDIPIQSSGSSICVKVVVNEGSNNESTYTATNSSDDSKNPIFDSVFHSLIKKPSSVKLVLRNEQQIIGTSVVSYDQIKGAKDHYLVHRSAVGKEGWFEYSVRLNGFQRPVPSLPATNNTSIPIEAQLVEDTSLQTTPLISGTPPTITDRVRITLLRGYGFEIQRFRFKKNDIPDVYCLIDINQETWRTKTVRDSTTPEFNESREFHMHSAKHFVSIDVFDEDKHSADDELGSVRITLGRLLLSPTVEVEIQQNGRGSGAFLVMAAEMIPENTNHRKDE